MVGSAFLLFTISAGRFKEHLLVKSFTYWENVFTTFTF